AASDPDAFPVQLLPDLLRTVDLLVLVPDSHDLDTELLVALRARRASLRLSLLLLLCVVGRRSDRQYIADRLDSVLLTVLVDERHHHFARRSSSACAKYADALRRISLARRSSRFSRSSSLSRSRSWLVRPGRCPASLWRRRIQPRRVSAEQPIFWPPDWIAAHSDSYSCACSPTSRTARSRTSAEYCFALAMAPISQGLEPPANSGRFTYVLEATTGFDAAPAYGVLHLASNGELERRLGFGEDEIVWKGRYRVRGSTLEIALWPAGTPDDPSLYRPVEYDAGVIVLSYGRPNDGPDITVS